MTELRAYNLGDTLFDEFPSSREHSIGIAQLEAEDVKAHGYLSADATVEQIRDRLRKPKEAIMILAQEIGYQAKMANIDVQSKWAAGSEDQREVIVRGMTSAKDTDDYYKTTGFGDMGVDSYHIIKKKNLLDQSSQ